MGTDPVEVLALAMQEEPALEMEVPASAREEEPVFWRSRLQSLQWRKKEALESEASVSDPGMQDVSSHLDIPLSAELALTGSPSARQVEATLSPLWRQASHLEQEYQDARRTHFKQRFGFNSSGRGSVGKSLGYPPVLGELAEGEMIEGPSSAVAEELLHLIPE